MAWCPTRPNKTADRDLRAALFRLIELSEAGREAKAADLIRAALYGSSEDFYRFLSSHELWGGSGSIADQALIEVPSLRGQLEEGLIELGRLQLAVRRVNPRTEGWVRAFERWEQQGRR
jgi:hypothetical protein